MFNGKVHPRRKPINHYTRSDFVDDRNSDRVVEKKTRWFPGGLEQTRGRISNHESSAASYMVQNDPDIEPSLSYSSTHQSRSHLTRRVVINKFYSEENDTTSIAESKLFSKKVPPRPHESGSNPKQSIKKHASNPSQNFAFSYDERSNNFKPAPRLLTATEKVSNPPDDLRKEVNMAKFESLPRFKARTRPSKRRGDKTLIDKSISLPLNFGQVKDTKYASRTSKRRGSEPLVDKLISPTLNSAEVKGTKVVTQFSKRRDNDTIVDTYIALPEVFTQVKEARDANMKPELLDSEVTYLPESRTKSTFRNQTLSKPLSTMRELHSRIGMRGDCFLIPQISKPNKSLKKADLNPSRNTEGEMKLKDDTIKMISRTYVHLPSTSSEHIRSRLSRKPQETDYKSKAGINRAQLNIQRARNSNRHPMNMIESREISASSTNINLTEYQPRVQTLNRKYETSVEFRGAHYQNENMKESTIITDKGHLLIPNVESTRLPFGKEIQEDVKPQGLVPVPVPQKITVQVDKGIRRSAPRHDTGDSEKSINCVLSNLKQMIIIHNGVAEKTLPYCSFPKEILDIIRVLPGNDKCCDCGKTESDGTPLLWTSVSYGTLLCRRCAFRHITKCDENRDPAVKDLSNDWNAIEVFHLLEGGNRRFLNFLASKKKKVKRLDGVLCNVTGAHQSSINDEFDRSYSTKPALLYLKALSKRAKHVFEMHTIYLLKMYGK